MCFCFKLLPVYRVDYLARTTEHPEGRPDLSTRDRRTVELANLITANTLELATRIYDNGGEVSIENPVQSLLLAELTRRM